MTTTDNWILYDGDCPFCRSYVSFMRLREAAGPIRLIDARLDTPERRLVQQQGLDLDEGMVLYYAGAYFHGAACLNRLALMSTGSGMVNSLCAALFRAEGRARNFYPWLRRGRNLVLRLLRRKKIGNS